MAVPADLEIARHAALKPLDDIAADFGVGSHLLEPYADHVMKIKLAAIDELLRADLRHPYSLPLRMRAT